MTDPADLADAATSPARPSWLELPVLLLLSFGLAFVLQAVLLQAFVIPSGSMEQTLHGCPGCEGDRVLVDKAVYDVREVRRGEVVVFSGEGSWGSNGLVPPDEGGVVSRALRGVARAAGAAGPDDTDYVKRVIGLPGDRVACCTADGDVTVQPAGSGEPVPLDEPYVFEDDEQPFCAAGLGSVLCPVGAEGVLVPEGRLWVMGDHRSASADSRARRTAPGGGTVPVDRVVGRAFAIVWPLGRADLLTVPATFDEDRWDPAGR